MPKKKRRDGGETARNPGSDATQTAGETEKRVEERPLAAKHRTDGSGPDGRRPHAIVGVGASAGGLEAFVGLLSHVSTENGIAYVLVQHLDPAHQSLLPEILDRAGNIPVISATDGLRLEADRAYVIPSGWSMTTIDGT